MLEIANAMLAQVGDQLFDDDAQARSVAFPEVAIDRIATRGGHRIAQGGGPRDVDALPVGL